MADEASLELARWGRLRQIALGEALSASRTIARLALDALAAGMSKSEIARTAQVSRPTLDAMLARERRRRADDTREVTRNG